MDKMNDMNCINVNIEVLIPETTKNSNIVSTRLKENLSTLESKMLEKMFYKKIVIFVHYVDLSYNEGSRIVT